MIEKSFNSSLEEIKDERDIKLDTIHVKKLKRSTLPKVDSRNSIGESKSKYNLILYSKASKS